MTLKVDSWPAIPTHPGEVLDDMIGDHGLTQSAVAQLMGRPPQVINEIVRGKKAVTAETAHGLAKVFGVSPAFWINLQAYHDGTVAHIAEREAHKKQVDLLKRFPILEAMRRGWIPNVKDKSDRVAELCKFLGIGSLDRHLERQPVSFRITGGPNFSQEALSVWLRRGELVAREMRLPEFDAERLRAAVPELRSLTVLEAREFGPRLTRIFADAGVGFAVVRELPKVGANGITRWLPGGNPLIQLNLKWKWADVFWFTLFHEVAHVLQPERPDVMHYGNGNRDATNADYEDAANAFAADVLIPRAIWRNANWSPPISEAEARSFAAETKIHPGIVVGRLHHEKLLPRTHLHGLRAKFQWREKTD